MAHRVVGDGNLLHHLPPLVEIARDRSPLVVVQKAAQVGLTELMVNTALWAAATNFAQRGHVLFLEPTAGQMGDFAQARFDRAIEDSPTLHAMLRPQPPRRRAANSMRLKAVGPGYIYLRGADDPRQVASVDADLVLADEFDFMRDGMFELMQKRIASSARGRVIVASTPRLPETGINALYLQSDQRRYALTCSSCGHEQFLEWEHNVDQSSARVVCARCRRELDVRSSQGRWIPTAPGNPIHGYQLSRLYSPWADIGAMVAAAHAPTPAGLQEFYHSDLGEPFVVEGAGLTIETLDSCRRAYETTAYNGQRCVMGVDVGTHLHVVIREYGEQQRHDDAQPRTLWFAGILPGSAWDQLTALVARYHVAGVLIDALPETQKANAFVDRHPGLAAVARYSRSQPGSEILYPHDGQPRALLLNRTEAIEHTFERMRGGQTVLPTDARSLGGIVTQGMGEYYRELTALQRVLDRDAEGNWVARWQDRGRADHFAHAEIYALYAEMLVAPSAVGPLVGTQRSRWRTSWSER